LRGRDPQELLAGAIPGDHATGRVHRWSFVV
jgi:hypothetical protein